MNGCPKQFEIAQKRPRKRSFRCQFGPGIRWESTQLQAGDVPTLYLRNYVLGENLANYHLPRCLKPLCFEGPVCSPYSFLPRPLAVL